MRSVRGSRPKMASDSVTDPAFLPSRPVTCSSMSRTLPSRADRNRRLRRIIGELELAGLWYAVRQFLLHRVTHRDPAAFDAGYGAFNHDQSAGNVGAADLEIERGHA